MDTKLLEALYWKGIPVFDMGSKMVTVDVGWGSAKFHKMGREKVLLINALLPFGYELLMCDTDMVWLKVYTSFNSVIFDLIVHRCRMSQHYNLSWISSIVHVLLILDMLKFRS